MWLALTVFLIFSSSVIGNPLTTEKQGADEHISHLQSNTSTSSPVDVCEQPPMKKSTLIECDAYLPMYTYRSERNNCEGFIYGGCGGSENLFETREACEARCKHNSRDTRDVDEMIAEE